MQPRVLFRTHYQVDEPAIVELLVKLCASPVRSAYNEVVAQRVAQEIRRRGKHFNVAAGKYALDLARGLGVVNEQNVWTEKGHLVGLLAEIGDAPWEGQLNLSQRERLLHFTLFVEADGAAVVHIARYLLEHRKIPNSQSDWNDIAKELFVQIYSECLVLAGTTADRVALRREVDRIRSYGYTGKSGSHKMFVHLQALFRMGLVDRAPTLAARRYLAPEGDGDKGLRALTQEIPNLYALETVVKQRQLIEVAARVFGTCRDVSAPSVQGANDLVRLLIPVYRRVMATGVPLCPLTTLIGAVQIDLLAGRGELLPYEKALSLLVLAQKAHIADLRFHVDRRGVPAFLKLSDALVAAYSGISS